MRTPIRKLRQSLRMGVLCLLIHAAGRGRFDQAVTNDRRLIEQATACGMDK